MAKLLSNVLECDGDCGSKIEVNLRGVSDPELNGLLMGCAETLGWTTRDRPGKKDDRNPEVYCEFCQKRAKRIVEGQ